MPNFFQRIRHGTIWIKKRIVKGRIEKRLLVEETKLSKITRVLVREIQALTKENRKPDQEKIEELRIRVENLDEKITKINLEIAEYKGLINPEIGHGLISAITALSGAASLFDLKFSNDVLYNSIWVLVKKVKK